ncbi:hypothetical protein BGZ60DRAFT_419785 [Tricladium varicosporioides]|nr:hypothetical protein BGZ60DRAFT_419785 [Hymenoscyphus varicosporioides]
MSSLSLCHRMTQNKCWSKCKIVFALISSLLQAQFTTEMWKCSTCGPLAWTTKNISWTSKDANHKRNVVNHQL